MLVDGKERVLLVDFESSLPEKLGKAFSERLADIPYAVALLLENGDECSVSYDSVNELTEPQLPTSLQWLRFYLRKEREFVTQGGSSKILWRKA